MTSLENNLTVDVATRAANFWISHSSQLQATIATTTITSAATAVPASSIDVVRIDVADEQEHTTAYGRGMWSKRSVVT